MWNYVPPIWLNENAARPNERGTGGIPDDKWANFIKNFSGTWKSPPLWDVVDAQNEYFSSGKKGEAYNLSKGKSDTFTIDHWRALADNNVIDAIERPLGMFKDLYRNKKTLSDVFIARNPDVVFIDDIITNPIRQGMDILQFMSDPQTWLRGGALVAGAGMVIFGAIQVLR